MSYTPPLGTLVAFTWEGAQPYTAPAGSDVAFAHTPTVFAIDIAATVAVTAALALQHVVIDIDGVVSATVTVVAALDASHGVSGTATASIPVSAGQTSTHGVALDGVASITLRAAASIEIDRYELRGEVRFNGVLVNRRVRAYLRSSGALLSQADTVAGKFALHAGFAAAECYITPIDMADGATDWLPPTANRIISVQALDVA